MRNPHHPIRLAALFVSCAAMVVVAAIAAADTEPAGDKGEKTDKVDASKQPIPAETAAQLGSLKGLNVFAGDEKSPALKLRGSDARQQLAVTGSYEKGAVRDLTRKVRYDVAPAGVVRVDEKGLVTAAGDGSATITVKSPEGQSATLSVTVEQFTASVPVNFANQIVPIFTKLGCNSGGCHGKSGGQNGFRLSLLGFEPTEDYEHLVKEARGRRLFPAAPDRSLLLLKATGTMPHGGGKRLDVGSRRLPPDRPLDRPGHAVRQAGRPGRCPASRSSPTAA